MQFIECNGISNCENMVFYIHVLMDHQYMMPSILEKNGILNSLQIVLMLNQKIIGIHFHIMLLKIKIN